MRTIRSPSARFACFSNVPMAVRDKRSWPLANLPHAARSARNDKTLAWGEGFVAVHLRGEETSPGSRSSSLAQWQQVGSTPHFGSQAGAHALWQLNRRASRPQRRGAQPVSHGSQQAGSTPHFGSQAAAQPLGRHARKWSSRPGRLGAQGSQQTGAGGQAGSTPQAGWQH
jgi:hypothetical protein